MLRSTLIVVAVATSTHSGFAQRASDAGSVYPISAPVKHAGVFNVNTRRWMSPAKAPAHQFALGVQIIFDNTCTWAGGSYYAGTGSCETYIDEGEIPGADNLDFANEGGLGASASNNVVLFQFGYCTNFAVPELEIGFYDSLGGACAGQAPPTGGGQPSLATQACPAALALSGINPLGTAYYNIGAAGLPGDATPGGSSVSCWIVATYLGNSGFCLRSEGDGVWDNSPDLDRFNWSWRMNNTQVAGTALSGMILSGEPAALPNPVVLGACTYNLTCDSDPFSGSACGTGRGADDSFWINVDGDVADGVTNTGVSCVGAPLLGTTCYWFGGYPGNPFGSYWMTMIAKGDCVPRLPQVFNCQLAPTLTQGCQSTVATAGLPSATMASPFTITFAGLNAQTLGVVFYGITGTVNIPWNAQSKLCVKSPTERLSGVPGALGGTGGSLGLCNGALNFDFNRVIQGDYPGFLGVPMSVGQRVDLQAWQRDPLSLNKTNLTDAVTFTIGQ